MAKTKPDDTLTTSIKRRKKHFHRKRRYAAAFDDAGYPLIAQRLYDCEETQVLACCSHCGKSWWIANHCKLRVCPLCSFKESLKRKAFILAMTHGMKHPKLVTLTMRTWTGDPREGITYLRAAWNKLRRTAVLKSVVGGAYQIEVKPKPHGYHIHMHVIMDAPYIPYQHLFSTWSQIIEERVPQIDIRAASDDKAKQYVAKYASKSADFDATPDTVVRWYLATKGMRLFATFGSWYTVTIDDYINEETPQKPPNTCPWCTSQATTFFARDGPYLFGHEIWTSISHEYLGDETETRPIPLVKRILDAPETTE